MRCINQDIVIDNRQSVQMKKNVQYWFHPSNITIDIEFMVHIIPGILDHHLDGTHYQWPNCPSISTVANDVQHAVDGPYCMFWLNQQPEVDGLYQIFCMFRLNQQPEVDWLCQIFWLNQVRSDPIWNPHKFDENLTFDEHLWRIPTTIINTIQQSYDDVGDWIACKAQQHLTYHMKHYVIKSMREKQKQHNTDQDTLVTKVSWRHPISETNDGVPFTPSLNSDPTLQLTNEHPHRTG